MGKSQADKLLLLDEKEDSSIISIFLFLSNNADDVSRSINVMILLLLLLLILLLLLSLRSNALKLFDKSSNDRVVLTLPFLNQTNI